MVMTVHGSYAGTAGLFIVPESAHSDNDAVR